MSSFKDFFKHLSSLPSKTKNLLALGLTLGLIVALPLFLFAVKQTFEFRKKADQELAVPVPDNSFTVETFLKNPDGSQVRFTKINAKTIVRYMEADGSLTKPKVCYQGNNDGQCPVTNNCMLNGYLNINIRDNDKPCTKLKRGWYSTHWNKSLIVDEVTYQLTYPNTNCTDKVCTQEEFLNTGRPYHYGIYEQISPSPTPTARPTATPTPTPSPSPTATPSASPSGSPTASPTPSPQSMEFRVKFAGVADEKADGAKIKVRFFKGTTDVETSPITVSHVANGVYKAQITLASPIPAGAGYTFYVKGEKHISRKFCQDTGQVARCTGLGNINVPAVGDPTKVYDFTGLALEPGDLPVQDGKADGSDFAKIEARMAILCEDLTALDKATADLDYSGCVNTTDAFLMRKTLETKYDDD